MLDMVCSGVWHASPRRVTWLIGVYSNSHSGMWHGLFTRESWLIPMCDTFWGGGGVELHSLKYIRCVAYSRVWHGLYSTPWVVWRTSERHVSFRMTCHTYAWCKWIMTIVRCECLSGTSNTQVHGIYIYIYIYTYIYIYMYICMFQYIYMYIYTCIYSCTHMDTNACMNTFIFIGVRRPARSCNVCIHTQISCACLLYKST